MANIPNHPTPGRFTRFKWRILSSSLSMLVHLLVFLFTLIKWAFSPIAFLFTVMVGIPFGRFGIKVPVQANFQQIEEDDIPDPVWLELQHSKQVFMKEGFIPGQYLSVNNMSKNLESHMLIMLNRAKKVAVGITCVTQNPGHKHENHLLSCEFSTICPNDQIIDLTSTSEVDPFTVDTRQRIFFETDELSLYRLFIKFIEAKQCPCPESILDKLEFSPEKIILEEYQSSFESGLKNGFVIRKEDNFQLTWKGAATSAFRTMWPTSDFFHRKTALQAKTFFKEIDIDLDSYEWLDAQEDNYTATLKNKIKGLNTAIQASKSLARQHDPLAYPVGVLLSNTVDKTGIESITVLYENYLTLRQGRFHRFNSFSIANYSGENTVNLLDDDDFLASDKEWLEYEQEIKIPLPSDLGGVCSSKQATEIALNSFKDANAKSDYEVESLELRVMPSSEDLALDNPKEKELVWLINAYKLTTDEDYVPIQCILNAKTHQVLKIVNNIDDFS